MLTGRHGWANKGLRARVAALLLPCQILSYIICGIVQDRLSLLCLTKKTPAGVVLVRARVCLPVPVCHSLRMFF